MDEKKQIEEMAKLACSIFDGNCMGCSFNFYPPCPPKTSVERLYAAGYRKQSGWISVDERLPESPKIVIVCDEYGNVGEAYFYQHNRRFRWVYNEELAFATHWMPLPEPPKGE